MAMVNVRAVMVAVVVLAAKLGSAQTDEIQVYDAGIAEKGKLNLTWHNNFTPAGVTTPAFAGALIADKSWNGVPEWACGVTDWFEAGSEVRLIVGWHLRRVDIIVNPILDTAYDGLKNMDLAPATRVAYNWTKTWATALEEYDDFGPLRRFRPAKEQSHQLYGVVDHSTKLFSIEAGVGFGLTKGSDRWTLKLILSRDLN